jgi:hypothetical protein
MSGGAFYNPSNTAMEAVVLFIRRPGFQPPERAVAGFRERVLEY